jgi:general transcription factor 3C polypeptide 3 (transcription factor C subunit 4)
MQRQSDNRHHQVSQGLAFFGRYRKLRGPCQEVEYNLGRAYHSIGAPYFALQPSALLTEGSGLVDSAIKQYEKVLEMETERRLGQMTLDDDADDPTPFDSFACEAAYNLQLVYMTTNNRDLARQVAKQWLTL